MTEKQQFKQNTTDMYDADNKKALKPLQEYPLGNHVILEVVESDSCQGCFFSNGNKSCTNPIMACSRDERADGKNVVFIERSFVREYEKKNNPI